MFKQTNKQRNVGELRVHLEPAQSPFLMRLCPFLCGSWMWDGDNSSRRNIHPDDQPLDALRDLAEGLSAAEFAALRMPLSSGCWWCCFCLQSKDYWGAGAWGSGRVGMDGTKRDFMCD